MKRHLLFLAILGSLLMPLESDAQGTKISDLPSLTGASAATNDVIPIVDVSAGSSGSKKITLAELAIPLVTPGNLVTAAGTMTGTQAATFRNSINSQKIVNVRDFGAVGDGVADDTRAVQAAALSIGDGTGGVLYFPRGTYLFGEAASSGTGAIPWTTSAYGATTLVTDNMVGQRPSLQVYSNMTIAGDGVDVTILKQADSTDAIPFINVNGASNVTFRDFTLDGNRSRLQTPYNDGEGEGIDTKNDVRNLTVQRVKFREISSEAIDLDNDAYDLTEMSVRVLDCTFENIGGSAIHSANWITVERCLFRNCAMSRYRDATDGVGGGAEGQGALDGAFEKVVIRDCQFFDNARDLHNYTNATSATLEYGRGNFTFASNPSAGHTLTAGGRTYTFVGGAKRFTGVASTNVLTSNSHGWADGTAVTILHKSQGGAASNLNEGVTYYIRDATTNTFKLAATNGGVALSIGSDITTGNSYITDDPPGANEIAILQTVEETVGNVGYSIRGMDKLTAKNTNVTATWITPAATAWNSAFGATTGSSMLMVRSLIPGSAGNSAISATGGAITASGAALTGGGSRSERFLRVENCWFENNLEAATSSLSLGDGSTDALDVLISGCSWVTGGIAVNGFRSGTMTGCNVQMIHNRYSASVVNLAGAVALIGNDISGGAVYLNGATDARIIGNRISSPYGAILAGGAASDDVSVIGNYLATSGNILAGTPGTATVVSFNVSGQTGIILQGNRIVGGTIGAIVTDQSVVTGNVCTGQSAVSIRAVNAANVIQGNRVDIALSFLSATGINVNSGNLHSASGTLGAPVELQGAGSPEGVFTAPIGSTYRRTDGGAATSFYVKESGTGNTGWVAK